MSHVVPHVTRRERPWTRRARERYTRGSGQIEGDGGPRNESRGRNQKWFRRSGERRSVAFGRWDWDSNPGSREATGFQDRRNGPLCHPTTTTMIGVPRLRGVGIEAEGRSVGVCGRETAVPFVSVGRRATPPGEPCPKTTRVRQAPRRSLSNRLYRIPRQSLRDLIDRPRWPRRESGAPPRSRCRRAGCSPEPLLTLVELRGAGRE